jgi:hypothetical protein
MGGFDMSQLDALQVRALWSGPKAVRSPHRAVKAGAHNAACPHPPPTTLRAWRGACGGGLARVPSREVRRLQWCLATHSAVFPQPQNFGGGGGPFGGGGDDDEDDEDDEDDMPALAPQ